MANVAAAGQRERVLASGKGRSSGGEGRAMQQSTAPSVASLPEYLEQHEIDALIRLAPSPRAALLMLLQWRAGLRVSEGVAVEVSDLSLDGAHPTIRVRRGKGNRARLVPVHPELRVALRTLLAYTEARRGPLVGVGRSQAWRWVQTAAQRAQEAGLLAPGRQMGTPRYATQRRGTGWPLAFPSTWCRAGSATPPSRRRWSTWPSFRTPWGTLSGCRSGSGTAYESCRGWHCGMSARERRPPHMHDVNPMEYDVEAPCER